MITVEKWYLQMTENVQRTYERLAGASQRAKASFTKVQDTLKEATGSMGHAADEARQKLGQAGNAFRRVFNDAKRAARDGVNDMRRSWDKLTGRDSFRNGASMSAKDAATLFTKDGKFDNDGVKARRRAESAQRRKVGTFRTQLGRSAYQALELGGGTALSPLLTSIMRLSGPVAIAAAAYMGAAKSYAAVKDFEPSARELRLANMGKSPAEQNALRGQVLGLAGQEGFNAKDTTAAFIEVQRSSGQTAATVQSFVAEVGKAAGALNMDFVPMVAGSAKTMKDFGIPLAQANELLDSNVKAMAIAGLDYQTLAKAQADYAAGARLANQRVDSANSLFAAFTANGQDAGDAGENLVGAMEALRKPSVIRGLKGIGVNVLDAKGQLRQMTDVARDMVPELAKLDGKKFDALKQQFAGDKGMIALLDLAKGGGDNLLATLDKFKDSKLGISDQLEAAKNDLDLVAKQIEERMNTAWITIGDSMKPVFTVMQKSLLWVVELFADGMQAAADPAQYGIRKAKEYAKEQNERIDRLAAPASTGSLEERQRGIADLYAERKKLQNAYDVSVKNGLTSNADRFKNELFENRKAIVKASEAWGKTKQKAGTEGPGTTQLLADNGGNKDTLKKGAEAIVGGGKQVRNVNVTIQKLVEKLEVRTAGTVREGISNVRQEVEQALIDIVRGGEAALANG